MKNGRGGKGGHGMNNGMNADADINSQNNSFGGKHNRFGVGTQAQPQVPEAQPEQNPSNI